MGANHELGKILMIVGVGVVLIGFLLWSGVGRGWLGHLPGDIHVERKNFSFHFPLVTCLVVSAIVSLLLWLFRAK